MRQALGLTHELDVLFNDEPAECL